MTRPTDMRPASTTVTIALLAALLAGCTGTDRAGSAADRPSATDTPPPVTATPTTPDGTPPTGTVPTGPVPTGPVPPGPGATDAAAERVTLFRSGGFAGRGDNVTVESDGRWTVVDRAGSRRTGKLDAADLGRLRGLAADPRLTTEARRTATASSCADAFTYRLTVGAVETGYVDCPADPAPPPATRALVELLLRVTG
ncbi:protealysin inhibitor emfourin [Micromonospora sp. MH99]|uniref:protealysin inhibitor emfourin n=1 Tax=Micromonospora sp. MH99 TaxID=1945510 RepID=UPI001F254AA3|nr:protealysin inhibitor emfourin [Micromonospora sp. MH99]